MKALAMLLLATFVLVAATPAAAHVCTPTGEAHCRYITCHEHTFCGEAADTEAEAETDGAVPAFLESLMNLPLSVLT